MYSNPQTCVKTKAGLTPLFITNKGVRQGCNLSPTLFNMFINDLVNDLDDTNCAPPSLHNLLVSCLLYADDVVMLSESETGLQRALDKLNAFCTKWNIHVNLKKTKVMIFNKTGRTVKNIKFSLGAESIQITNSYTYLGLTLSSSGSYSLAKKQLSLKARKAAFSIKPLIRTSLSPKALLKIYDTCIKSILLYACEIWGKDSSNDKCPVETTQNRFCKNILGVHRNSCNQACRAELGMFPTDIDISVRVIKYWLRLKQLDSSTHPLQVDALLCQEYLMGNSYKKNWLHHVKEIVDNTGYSFLWNINYPTLDNKNICTLLKRRLTDMYVQTFFHQLSLDNGKLRFYKSVKSEYVMENYLYHNEFNERSAICKIRTSAHPLEIERGRYKKLPVHERLCTYCPMNAVENETHFISQCTHYETERKTLFQTVATISPSFYHLNDHQKTTFLLKAQNPTIIQNVGQFINHCLQRRSQTRQ